MEKRKRARLRAERMEASKKEKETRVFLGLPRQVRDGMKEKILGAAGYGVGEVLE
jgi:hypothetical protein